MTDLKRVHFNEMDGRIECRRKKKKTYQTIKWNGNGIKTIDQHTSISGIPCAK